MNTGLTYWFGIIHSGSVVDSIEGALYKHGVDIVVIITKWLYLLAFT